MMSLWRVLDDYGIRPVNTVERQADGNDVKSPKVTNKKPADVKNTEPEVSKVEPAHRVEITDTVKYVNLKNESEVLTARFSNYSDDATTGYIKTNAPIAVALMGKLVGDIVDVSFPLKVEKVKIIEIIKGH
jgi:hypothetical protein